MTIKALIGMWNRFWFAPGSPVPIALFRIILGCVLLQDVLLMRMTAWRLFYSANPIIPFSSYILFWWGRDPRFDLMSLLPNSDLCHFAFLCLYILLLIFVTVGFHTQISAFGALLLNESLFNQFLLNLSGADVYLKISLLIISMSNAGDAFSIDNIRRTLKYDWRKTGFAPPLKPQWALRMMQVQLCYVYFITGLCKLGEPRWVDGTVLYYVTRYEDLIRFPVPFIFDNLLATRILSWLSLAFEITFPYLVWMRECRYYMLAVGVIFHLGVDWTLNIPLFEWIFIGSFILFVYPEDLTRCMTVTRAAVRKVFGPQIQVRFSEADLASIKLAGLIHQLDIFDRFEIQPGVHPVKNALGREPLIALTVNSRSIHEPAGTRALFINLPMMWIFSPLLLIPNASYFVNQFLASQLIDATTHPAATTAQIQPQARPA